MPYNFRDDIAGGDSAVEIEAPSLEELFVEAGKAFTEAMVDIESVGTGNTFDISLEEDDIESLFYDFLSELVYLKDSSSMLFSNYVVEKLETARTFKLEATAEGERIDYEKHDISADIKAVTMHRFKVEKTDGGWKAFVIFDL